MTQENSYILEQVEKKIKHFAGCIAFDMYPDNRLSKNMRRPIVILSELNKVIEKAIQEIEQGNYDLYDITKEGIYD
ncbi:hypothetical protein LCGC14_2935760 [marine sediment metagenome]|uniref:Uncharacterized protein n=1 Tax=marine sediment metagenome TaxID=412755 RepID=A0A0F8Y6K7_9ZZZZ